MWVSQDTQSKKPSQNFSTTFTRFLAWDLTHLCSEGFWAKGVGIQQPKTVLLQLCAACNQLCRNSFRLKNSPVIRRLEVPLRVALCSHCSEGRSRAWQRIYVTRSPRQGHIGQIKLKQLSQRWLSCYRRKLEQQMIITRHGTCWQSPHVPSAPLEILTFRNCPAAAAVCSKTGNYESR